MSEGFFKYFSPEQYNDLIRFSNDWKWIVLLISPFIFYTFKLLVHIVIKAIRRKLHDRFQTRKLNTFTKHFSKMKFERSLSWIITCIPGAIFIENFSFPPTVEKYLFMLVKILVTIQFIKLAMMISDALCELLADLRPAANHPLDKQIAPLLSKSLRIFIAIMGTLIFMQNMGINVTAVIAGLGVGGVAIAFAAQNTVANLFGTVTILMDTPFKIGDRVRINNTEGFVEEIGFRSTRVRTASNTLVSLPNSLVAMVQIDNLSEINSLYRFRTVLKFQLNSAPEKLMKFTEELTASLKQDPKVIQSTIAVYFSDITEMSKNITVIFQYSITDTTTESRHQELYLYLIESATRKADLKFTEATHLSLATS
jgi:MscS family membrane protein